jgi:ATP/maltotriose-dependent transcriptional regulator MalT/DNA-binding SARP family transcriptional activator
VRDALENGSVVLTAGAGSGKTTILDEVLAERPGSAAWVSCSDRDRDPGALLIDVVRAIAAAVPGAAETVEERFATASERMDPLAATRGLLGELPGLLVEPLLLVIDDAEHLEGADDSLRLISELLRAEQTSLRLAVATRRQLELRVAKPRAAGRLTELTAADLAFGNEECADLLRRRIGVAPGTEQVDLVMRATEGWPLGIALAAGLAAHGDAAHRVDSLDGLGSAPDLRQYLSEELLDSLDPELRAAAIDSSVARVITPSVAAALELPEDFAGRIERAGMLVRYVGSTGAYAYHPLLREFLIECLREGRAEDEQRRLHAAVAPPVAQSGDRLGAIEHWLAAERWAEAVAAIGREGPALLRTSPALLTRWLAQLPPDVQRLPALRMLEGELEWGAGEHQRALEPLREAVSGYRETRDSQHEWLARLFLAQALFWAGHFEELLDLAHGWDGADAPERHAAVAGVAWHNVLALTAVGRRDEAARLASLLRREPRTAALFHHVDALAALLVDLPAGRAEAALADPHSALRELERHDPHGRLAFAQLVTALVLLDIGEVEEAMEWFERSQREAERRGLGFVAQDAQLQRAALLAQQGRVADAELELELGRARGPQGTGWRSISRHTADAFIAAARGDAPEVVTATERALEQVRPGPVCFRVWAALDVAIALNESGSPDLARTAIDEAQSALDELCPGELGHYHRARLIATRAWLDHESGKRDAACDELRRCWEEAGGCAHQVMRAHWRQLKPILWRALAEGALAPETVIPALERAFPRGAALIEFTDHPQQTVRRAALSTTLASDHPAVLSRLAELAEDADADVATVAATTRERLRRTPPPLRFSLLGQFRVTRAGWEIHDELRPIDARLVRFLLVHGGERVHEDVIFEALWPGRASSRARRSLQVAVSRARQILDLPAAEKSLIEGGAHAYALALGERDSLDARDFLSAVPAALAERGAGQRPLLERARSLWGGEPLPEERYSDWATPYRERLTDRYIAVLSELVQLHDGAGEHNDAAPIARELVDIDPLNESAHRALITAYARAGRTGHALRQYLECRRRLVGELGIEPAAETSRLQARILAGEPV